jgi:polyisoprenoid-binding protein YceI
MNTTTATAVKTKWTVDPTHSEITFKVKHLMISSVKGEFTKFSATVNALGDDFSNASMKVNIDASSIFTNEKDRDKHLKSADFFDVAQYPELLFEGTSFTKTDGENFRLTGFLTMKSIRKEVAFDVVFGGLMKDPYGNEKAGFSLSGKINRKEWGLNWNAALEAGGVLVGDEVKIGAEIQLIKTV